MKDKKTHIELISENDQTKKEMKKTDSFAKGSSHPKLMISAEEKNAILKARAQILAAEENDQESNKEYMDVLEFSLANERYAVETSYVREVYPLKDYTILPGLPAFVLGILNVRGQIISVIDLKKFFHLPAKGIGELNKVIIIHNERMEFGILADVIHGNQLIDSSTILDTLSNKSDIGSDYLKGVTMEHLIVLDVNKILNDKKIIINQETE